MNIVHSEWIKYNFNDLTKRPEKPDRYLVCRKDGKIHWEVWNDSGWAYNENSIEWFAIIYPPLKTLGNIKELSTNDINGDYHERPFYVNQL